MFQIFYDLFRRRVMIGGQIPNPTFPQGTSLSDSISYETVPVLPPLHPSFSSFSFHGSPDQIIFLYLPMKASLSFLSCCHRTTTFPPHIKYHQHILKTRNRVYSARFELDHQNSKLPFQSEVMMKKLLIITEIPTLPKTA